MNRLLGYIFLALLVSVDVLAYPQEDFDYYDTDYTDEEDNATATEDEQVEDTLPQFRSQGRTLTVKEGDTVRFDCETVRPSPHLLLLTRRSDGAKDPAILYAGEIKVLDIAKVQLEGTGTFVIENVRRNNRGTFTCQFQSRPIVKLEYVLNVEYAPQVKMISAPEQRVAKGEAVTMSCEARGNPEPVITWSKVKGKMPSGEMEVEGLSITLEDVDRHVEGVYECKADNGIGVSTQKTKVIVEYEPEIVTEKAVIRTGEGDKVELVCIVHARPAAEVTWVKDDQPLDRQGELEMTDAGHRHTIVIPHVTEEHFGSYTCIATNERGEDEAIINITDLPNMPRFTSPPMSKMDSEYSLTWETESYYPITEYNLKYRKARYNESSEEPGPWINLPVELADEDVLSDGLNHRMNHTITNLEPATEYQAKVTVKNKYKWGAEAAFDFSTRKETTSPHVIGGSSCISSFTIAVFLSSLLAIFAS